MSELKIPNKLEPCLNLEDAKKRKTQNEAKIAAAFGSVSGVSFAIMIYLLAIRYTLPPYEKKENLYWIVALFGLSLVCAAAILGLFIKEDQDYKSLKKKMATIESIECDICKEWMGYSAPAGTESVTVSANPDSGTYELPKDTLIQKILVQSTVKPTVYWINKEGTTADVTNIFDFTKVQSGYVCIVNAIYLSGDNKLTIDPHDGNISYLADATISDNMREFIVKKQIIAQTCISDVVVVNNLKLIQTSVLCCS